MSSFASLARPYARAVFAEALATDSLALWQQRLQALVDALSDKSLVPVVRSKAIQRDAKIKAFAAALGADVALAGLARLLVQNDRLELAHEIAAQFAELVRKQEHKQAVIITSPYPLDDADLQALTQRLKQRIGMQLEVAVRVDPELIAGVQIRAQGWQIDGNMRAQLADLSRRLIA